MSRSADAIDSWKDDVAFTYLPAAQALIDRAVALKAVCDRHGVL